MTYVPNPFRVRLAEQQRDAVAFLRTFGVRMLDTLPVREVGWDRLVVLRSAPGAGKTSLLRMLTPQVLTAVTESPAEFAHLLEPLTRIGALDAGEPQVLGVLVSLGKDYGGLMDLGPPGAGSDKVFFRLLDARIMMRLVEAVVTAAGLRFPRDARRIGFVVRDGGAGQRAAAALERLIGSSQPAQGPAQADPTPTWSVDGWTMLKAARAHEAEVLRLLDSLLPVSWKEAHGHSRIYTLQVASGVDITVDGDQLPLRPAMLLDDVHDLADRQRHALFTELMDRSLDIGRWIAERYSALRDDELLTDSSPDGRDVLLIRLEDAMSEGLRGGRSSATYRLFGDIADSRARAPLSLAGHETDSFTSLLRQRDDVPEQQVLAAYASVRQRVDELCDENPQYRPWMQNAEAAPDVEPLKVAVRWRELQLHIERDLLRPAQTLFEDEAPERAYKDITGSDTRGAARLFLAREHGIPYYAGAAVLAELASNNVEQYLGLAGDLFDLMLASVVLGQHPSLTATEQDRRARAASRNLWEAVPQRVPFGDDVASLLHAIAANGRSETYRPNAPYAPGVTGTAFAYVERGRLLKATERGEPLGVTKLGRAVTSAVANNLLQVDEPNKTKDGTWTVLYLNRLLCPFFGLPLQRGGFREQPLNRLSDWLERSAAVREPGKAPDPESPLPGVDKIVA